LLALTIAFSGTSAHAQLRVPSLNLPLPQRIGALDSGLLRQPQRLLDEARLGDLTGLRGELVGQLLRRHRDVLVADPRGLPAVRREILAWSPSAAALQTARDAGLRLLRERRLEAIDETSVVLGVPEGMDTAAMLERLRSLDPDGVYDFNHVYQGSGAAATPAARDAAGPGNPVGLIDGGVDARHAVFADTRLVRWGCNDAPHPSAHGTSVAALIAGRSPQFAGAAPAARLYAADIYCDQPAGGAADTIAQALNWMALQQVGVINLSIVGPPNRTLERAVAALVRRGHLLVAAVGNDGPAAPALYPASYPGVVGVTAVDRRGKVLPEAARGPQVMFAAPGSDMVSAVPGEPPYRRVRGTSFAAPVVAALLADRLARPDPEQARQALADLVALAGGARNPELGYGVVGMAHRVDPTMFRRNAE
jgi:subtilisin family serine protease